MRFGRFAPRLRRCCYLSSSHSASTPNRRVDSIGDGFQGPIVIHILRPSRKTSHIIAFHAFHSHSSSLSIVPIIELSTNQANSPNAGEWRLAKDFHLCTIIFDQRHFGTHQIAIGKWRSGTSRTNRQWKQLKFYTLVQDSIFRELNC